MDGSGASPSFPSITSPAFILCTPLRTNLSHGLLATTMPLPLLVNSLLQLCQNSSQSKDPPCKEQPGLGASSPPPPATIPTCWPTKISKTFDCFIRRSIYTLMRLIQTIITPKLTVKTSDQNSLQKSHDDRALQNFLCISKKSTKAAQLAGKRGFESHGLFHIWYKSETQGVCLLSLTQSTSRRKYQKATNSQYTTRTQQHVDKK